MTHISPNNKQRHIHPLLSFHSVCPSNKPTDPTAQQAYLAPEPVSASDKSHAFASRQGFRQALNSGAQIPYSNNYQSHSHAASQDSVKSVSSQQQEAKPCEEMNYSFNFNPTYMFFKADKQSHAPHLFWGLQSMKPMDITEF